MLGAQVTGKGTDTGTCWKALPLSHACAAMNSLTLRKRAGLNKNNKVHFTQISSLCQGTY